MTTANPTTYQPVVDAIEAIADVAIATADIGAMTHAAHAINSLAIFATEKVHELGREMAAEAYAAPLTPSKG